MRKYRKRFSDRKPERTPTETPTETPAEAGREPSEIPRDEKISEAVSGAISEQNAKDEETIEPATPHTYLGIFGQFDPYIVRTCTMLRHSSKRSRPGYHGGGGLKFRKPSGEVYTHTLFENFFWALLPKHPCASPTPKPASSYK